MRFTLLLTMLLGAGSTSAQLDYVGEFLSPTRLIYLTDNEPAIFIYEPLEEHIELYNTDLSLITEFEIPVEYEGIGPYHLFHVSRTLFDCDSATIEYLISFESFIETESYVKVLREDGSTLFELTGHYFRDETILSTNPTYGSRMVEDENGVLFAFETATSIGGSFPVTLYRSCGSIPGCANPCAGSDEGTVGLTEQNNNGRLNIYPNPGDNQFVLEYDLPEEHRRGRLILYDLQGREVHSVLVGPSMHQVYVNTSHLAAGRYQLVLRTTTGQTLSTGYVEMR